MSEVTAYVIDDQPVAVMLLADALVQRGIRVQRGGADVLEAEALIRAAAPGVVVFALRLPAFATLDAIGRLARGRADIPILVLARTTDDVGPVDAVEAGAAGFVTRGTAIDVLASTILALSRGELGVSREHGRAIAERLSAVARARPERKHLTDRQWQVWSLLARGLTNREIAEALGCQMRTAEDHVYTLLKALGLRSRQAAVAVYQATEILDDGKREVSGAP
jgi:DNA-binding NarL/FixJ family response regulator